MAAFFGIKLMFLQTMLDFIKVCKTRFTERIYHLVILKLDQSDTHMHTK